MVSPTQSPCMSHKTVLSPCVFVTSFCITSGFLPPARTPLVSSKTLNSAPQKYPR